MNANEVLSTWLFQQHFMLEVCGKLTHLCQSPNRVERETDTWFAGHELQAGSHRGPSHTSHQALASSLPQGLMLAEQGKENRIRSSQVIP